MIAADLKGFTQESLKDHVMKHGGPDGLVPAWLKQHNLRPFLEDYVKPDEQGAQKRHAGSSPEKPSGAEADLSTPEAVWLWLKKAFGVSGPDRGRHILSEKSLSYPLKGRDDAVESVTVALLNLVTKQLPEQATSDRTERKIPVCSALSGMGKTRMAEEVCAAFAEQDGSERAVLWGKLRAAIKVPRLGVIVTYGNGIGRVSRLEKQFSIQSSFAWRLLYFFFLRSRPGVRLETFLKGWCPSTRRN